MVEVSDLTALFSFQGLFSVTLNERFSLDGGFMGKQEIQPVHSEDQPWDFFGRNDAKAETPVLWPPHAKS